jgi:hypothetical protein
MQQGQIPGLQQQPEPLYSATCSFTVRETPTTQQIGDGQHTVHTKPQGININKTFNNLSLEQLQQATAVFAQRAQRELQEDLQYLNTSRTWMMQGQAGQAGYGQAGYGRQQQQQERRVA